MTNTQDLGAVEVKYSSHSQPAGPERDMKVGAANQPHERNRVIFGGWLTACDCKMQPKK